MNRPDKFSCTTVVRLWIIPLVFCCGLLLETNAQSHIDIIKNAPRDATFAQIDTLVSRYFRDNPEVKGTKQWERWKWYAQSHLDMDGKVANITARNMEALQQMNIHTTSFTNPAAGVSATGRLNGDWSPLGPFAIAAPAQNYLGRVNCMAFHPTIANTIFAGTPGGGLWKSTTNGTNWTPLTDGLPSSGISGIAIDPNNANIMYVLTGDGNGGNQWGYYVKETGCGVFKSTDGGVTWFTTGLSWSQSQVRYGYKLIIHPTNSNILLAATSDGIYRTTNGGGIWTQEIAGEFQDIEFKANDPTMICATRYGFSNLYVSTDTGDTWVAKAIPGGAITRGEVEVSDANTGLAYLLLGPQSTGSFRGLYTYNWNTEVFTLITNTPNLFTGAASGADNGGFPWWAIGLWVSPTNANNMLMGGVIGRRSTTGGTTWVADNDILHADSHGYFYNPLNATVFAVNDGGVFRSTNNGDTWTNITGNMQITQYYRMSGVDGNSNILLAGAQDNGHHLRTTNTTTYSHVITCCDGMDNGINYSNTNIMYGFTQYGGLNKSTDGGVSFFGIFPDIASGSEPWVVPFLVHTTTPTTLFYASELGLLRHTASGEPTNAWTNLGGGGLTSDFAMGTSNTDRAYIAGGSTIRRTDNLSNAAPTWTIKSGNPGWPNISGTSITSIDVNPDNSLDVWITFSGYNSATKVAHSTDGGDNWVNETDNLPNVPVHVIKVQDTNGSPAGAVYVGTDIGVFYRDNVNTGGQWIQYGNDLPKTIVTDMEVNETAGVITVSTYGRGFWRSPLFSGCDANLTLSSSLTGNQYHQASSTITFNSTIVGGAGTQILLKANSSVTLNPGFEIKAGNEMKAFIGPCSADNPVFRINNTSPILLPARRTDTDSLRAVKPEGNE
ncbi:MAG: hypothetical protein NTW29_21435 [Bacteroidetes bacterium]|nr:hypothetical protein [Bacteroidota bacterium]